MIVYDLKEETCHSGWVTSRFDKLEDVWQRIVRDRSHGDIYVGYCNNTERITTFDEFKSIITEDCKPYTVYYKTYGWDDDNERITMSETYKVRFYEAETVPVSTIKASVLKEWLKDVDDETEISFYADYYLKRYYPKKMEIANGKMNIYLSESDNQDKVV